ncbi:Nuclear pore complex protein Nup98-Nup96 [Amphibalanus amphitrite]|uniref:Nuclear pore complex protein Nup98-Nup96 n=1 Tax=Amphibalanus amphitrite TaxID=1232801 RepID=A0A6A4W3H8_AMPAM|nr:Nuclear pore complex protein Nup98-Nup96 [Amphibalanus amphitrite]
MGVSNNNYMLMFKLTDLMVALSMMRAGIRRNNTDAMLSGRQRFAPVFYTGPNHTYQRLLLRDTLQRVQAPPVIQQYLRATTSFTVTGDETRGEGGDFILEAKNRETKAWIPPGLPSIDQWRHASRCSERLKGVREAVLSRSGVLQTEFSDTNIPIQDSVDLVRADLRRRKYLDQPYHPAEYLTGVGGEYLHPDFANFDVVARHNYDVFKRRMLGEELEMHRLCVEPTDDDVEKLTKAELVAKLTAKLAASVPMPEQADAGSRRLGHGLRVFFTIEAHLAGLDLGAIVVFRRQICINPNDALQPSFDQGLAKPAHVTLERMWPTGKTSLEAIRPICRGWAWSRPASNRSIFRRVQARDRLLCVQEEYGVLWDMLSRLSPPAVSAPVYDWAGARQVLAQAEMAKKAAVLLRALLNTDREGGVDIGATLLGHLA